MLEKDFASKQIARFSALSFFPDEAEGKRELVCALQCFQTQEQGEKFVTDWIGNERECPKPVDIRRTAFDLEQQEKVRRREAWKQPTGLCPDCREWGAFGWLLRGDRFEHCPNEALHQDDVSDMLLDVLNSNYKRDKGLKAVSQADVRRVVGC